MGAGGEFFQKTGFEQGFCWRVCGIFLWVLFVEGFCQRVCIEKICNCAAAPRRCFTQMQNESVGDSGLCYINLYWVGGWYFETGSLGTL